MAIEMTVTLLLLDPLAWAYNTILMLRIVLVRSCTWWSLGGRRPPHLRPLLTQAGTGTASSLVEPQPGVQPQAPYLTKVISP